MVADGPGYMMTRDLWLERKAGPGGGVGGGRKEKKGR